MYRYRRRTEDTGEETEPEKELSEEQQREKELQDMIAQYNQKKNDPEYYYLPDTWNGKHLEWEQPKDTKGNLNRRTWPGSRTCGGNWQREGKADCSGKRKEQNADGLSRSDHEIYTSGTGWFNCKKGISEDRHLD